MKRTLGDPVVVECDLVRDGHEHLRAVVRHRPPGAAAFDEVEMHAVSADRWRGEFPTTALGIHGFQVEVWVDVFASWRSELERKVAGGQHDLDSELTEGAALLEAALAGLRGARHSAVAEAAERLVGPAPGAERAEIALAPELAEAMRQVAQRPEKVRGPMLEVDVDRELARTGAWYELFPRSFGGFAGVERQVPALAGLGFDVLYLPPIHPIGLTHRKGRNNSPTAEPGEPGSPWAIGGPDGGHTAVNPELGTLAELESLVATARAHGLEIALDFAIQCSPDHPWLAEHPEWFHHRPDGTLKYAENPPKKYQDIYNVNFGTDDWRALWDALRDALVFWVDRGVRVFRVDNPHTKPIGFWEWLIRTVRAEHPDVVFLAEAFTSPARMYALAKAGFSQSYTYFTWKNSAGELSDYVARARRRAVGVLPAELLRQHARHPPRVPPDRRPRGLRGAPGPGRDPLAELRHLLRLREPRGHAGGAGQRGVPRLREVRGQGAPPRRHPAAAGAPAERDPPRVARPRARRRALHGDGERQPDRLRQGPRPRSDPGLRQRGPTLRPRRDRDGSRRPGPARRVHGPRPGDRRRPPLVGRARTTSASIRPRPRPTSSRWSHDAPASSWTSRCWRPATTTTLTACSAPTRRPRASWCGSGGRRRRGCACCARASAPVDLPHRDQGLFEAVAPRRAARVRYEVEVEHGGHTAATRDPYSFLPTIGELDLHLVGEGRHEQLWDRLGAHLREIDGASGVAFAVWAPSARSVSVVGDWNGWDGRVHPMRSLGASGVWELFVPGIGPDAHYKYEIRGADGSLRLKADPVASAAEVPPRTASVVFRSGHEWRDADWIAGARRAAAARRAGLDLRGAPALVAAQPRRGQPLADPRSSWPRSSATTSLDMGFTHVELLPVMAHPFSGSWGYQVTSYFAPSPVLGSPDDLREFVDRLHERGRRRDPRLGAGPLPARRLRARPSSTARRSTSTPTPAAARTPTGAR